MGDPKAPPPVQKRGPGFLLVLSAFVLLLASLYVVYAFVPVISCPSCEAGGALKKVTDEPKTECEPCKGTGILKQVYNDPKTGKIGMLGGECPPCGGTGAIKTGKLGTAGSECPSCKGKGRITLHAKFNVVPLDPSKISLPDLKK
jgi:hypothetical protein